MLEATHPGVQQPGNSSSTDEYVIGSQLAPHPDACEIDHETQEEKLQERRAIELRERCEVEPLPCHIQSTMQLSSAFRPSLRLAGFVRPAPNLAAVGIKSNKSIRTFVARWFHRISRQSSLPRIGRNHQAQNRLIVQRLPPPPRPIRPSAAMRRPKLLGPGPQEYWAGVNSQDHVRCIFRKRLTLMSAAAAAARENAMSEP
jgi:hypothetical protein